MFRISMNVGFVTNSSSMIYSFPKELLDLLEVRAVLEAFEIQNGFVGHDLWSRSACETLAITKEQKDQARSDLNRMPDEYGSPPSIDDSEDRVVIIYGDEYSGIAIMLIQLIKNACDAAGLPGLTGTDYN